MNADRKVSFRRQPQLPGKNLFLRQKIVVLNPSIQADLTNGRWNAIQETNQVLSPLWSAFFDMPRVIAK